MFLQSLSCWGLVIIAVGFLWTSGPAISRNYIALRLTHVLYQPNCQVCWQDLDSASDQVLDSATSRATALRIRTMIMAGEPEQATVKFKSMVGISAPEKDILRILLIEALSRQARWNQVNELLDNQWKCNGALAEKLMTLGQAYEVAHDDKDAEAAFLVTFHVCSQEEMGIRALVHLAEKAAQQGHLIEAVGYYRLLVNTSPVSAPTMANFANLLYQTNALEEAVVVATRAIDLDPDYLGGYAVRGTAYYFRGESGSAIADLELVVRRSSVPSTSILWVLAQAYYRDGRRDDSTATLKQLLKIAPDFQPARDLLNKLQTPPR